MMLPAVKMSAAPMAPRMAFTVSVWRLKRRCTGITSRPPMAPTSVLTDETLPDMTVSPKPVCARNIEMLLLKTWLQEK